MTGDLGPGADADTLGLRDAAVARQRMHGRLAIGPDALLEGATHLGHVGFTHEVVLLMVERRVEEETVVVELEVLFRLANTTLTQGEELLALGERADGDRPFLERDRHK